SVTSKLN
ncbi:cyclophilin type peptidyl-prolyl cis-trans isomerase/CLD family protein, partial [Vibrio parahaemolyticus V-223/04]